MRRGPTTPGLGALEAIGLDVIAADSRDRVNSHVHGGESSRAIDENG